MKIRRMKLHVLLVPVLIFVFGFQTARAEETITVSNSVVAQPTNWTRQISLSKFHPKNGKLIEVRSSVSSRLLGDVKYESLELNPATLTIGMDATITLLGIDGQPIATAFPMQSILTDVSGFDGFWDFDGSSGGQITNLIASDIAQADTITNPTELQAYVGTDELFLGLRGNGRSYIEGTGNLSSIFNLDAQAAVTLTYVYEPPSIDLEKLTNGVDADSAPGPVVESGTTVQWEYIVENSGLNSLIDIVVNDDQGVDVSCPKSTLAPLEKMTCTASGIATTGQYINLGFVSGQPTLDDGTPVGERVSDSDLSHYFGSATSGSIGDSIWLDTDGNGTQNNDEPSLEGVTVRLLDEQQSEIATATTDVNGYLFENLPAGVYLIEVDSSTLPSGATPTFDADGIQTSHISKIDLQANEANSLQDFGYTIATIDIETHTNGDDADTPIGPNAIVGDSILWAYTVTNTSSVTVTNIEVTDNQAGIILCPKDELLPGERMICTTEGTAQPGQYSNTGSVSGLVGSPIGIEVTDSDPSHYFGVVPTVEIETRTNGEDADTPTGPEIPAGDAILWEYSITNTSPITLVEILVSDSAGASVTCPETVLGVGSSMTCTAAGIAELDQYENVGSVIGLAGSSAGPEVSNADPSHYLGINTAPKCPADLLPKIEFLGGTETKVEAQKTFVLPEGFDVFLVKRTHNGPFRFDIESATTTEADGRSYTTSWGKIERVWACAGNCTFTQALEGSVEIGQVKKGATIHAMVIDNDVDERYLWWAANSSQNQVEQITGEGMTNYLRYTVPVDATWHIFSEDSVGVVSLCIEHSPAGVSSSDDEEFNDVKFSRETVLPFVVLPANRP